MEYLEEYDDQFNDLDDDQPTVGNILNCIVSKSIISSVEKCTNETPTNNTQTFNLQNVKKSKHEDTLSDKDSQNHTITLKESMPYRERVNWENNTKAKDFLKNTSCNSKNNTNISEIESSSIAYKTNSASNHDNINNTKKSHYKQFEKNLKKTMPSYDNEIHNNVSALVKNSIVEKKDDLNVNTMVSKYFKKTNNVSKLVKSKKCSSVKKAPCVTKKSKHSQHKKSSIKNHVLLKKDDSLKSHRHKSPVVNKLFMNAIEEELNKLHGSVNDNSFSSNSGKNSTFNDATLKIDDELDDSDTEHIYLKINEIISSNESPCVERTKSLTGSVLETKTSSIEKTCVKDSVVKNNINIKTKQCASERDVYGSNVSTEINLPSPVIDPGECTSKLSKHNITISDLPIVNKSKHRDVAPNDSQSNIRLINELVSSSRNSDFENNNSVQNVQVNMDHANTTASVSLDKDKDYSQNVEEPTEEISIDNVEKNTFEEKDLNVHNTYVKNTNNENFSLKITPNMFGMHNTNNDEHSIENIDVTDALTKTNNDKASTLDSFIKKMEVKDICFKINGIISEHIKNVVDESTKNIITLALAKSFVNNDSITNSSSNIDKSNVFKTPKKSSSTQITSDDPSKETEVQKHSQNSILQHTTYLDNSTTSAPTIVTNIIHNLISNKTDLTKRIVQAFGIPYDSSNKVNVTEKGDKTQNTSKTIMDMSSDNTHYDSTLQNIPSSSKTQLNSTICMQPDNNVHRNISENKDRERKKSLSNSPLPPINEWITLMKDFNKAIKRASISKVDVNSGTIKKPKFQQETKNYSTTILDNFPSNGLIIKDNALENKNDAADMIKLHFRNKNDSIRQKANKSNLKTSSRCIKNKPNSIETANSMVIQETLSLSETNVEDNTLEIKNNAVATKQSCRTEIDTRSQSANLRTSSKCIKNKPNYTKTTKVANSSPILEVSPSNETDIEDNILRVKKKNIRKCSISSISSNDFNTSIEANLTEKSYGIKSNMISQRANLRKSSRCIKNKSNETEKIELTCSTPILKDLSLCETKIEDNTLKIKRKKIREFSTSSESFNNSFSSSDDIKMIKDICKMKNISISYKANLKKSLRCSKPKPNDTKTVGTPKNAFISQRKREKKKKRDAKDNLQKSQLVQFSTTTNNKRNEKKGIQSDNNLLLTSKHNQDKITDRFLSRVSKTCIQNLKRAADTSVSLPKAKVPKHDISSIIAYITKSHDSDAPQVQSLFSQKLNLNLSEPTTSQNFNSSFSETTLNTIKKPKCTKNINSQKQKFSSNDSVLPAKKITRQSSVKKTEVNNFSTSTTSRTRIKIQKINECKSDIIKTQCSNNTTREVLENEEEPPSTRVLRIRKK